MGFDDLINEKVKSNIPVYEAVKAMKVVDISKVAELIEARRRYRKNEGVANAQYLYMPDVLGQFFRYTIEDGEFITEIVMLYNIDNQPGVDLFLLFWNEDMGYVKSKDKLDYRYSVQTEGEKLYLYGYNDKTILNEATGEYTVRVTSIGDLNKFDMVFKKPTFDLALENGEMEDILPPNTMLHPSIKFNEGFIHQATSDYHTITQHLNALADHGYWNLGTAHMLSHKPKRSRFSFNDEYIRASQYLNEGYFDFSSPLEHYQGTAVYRLNLDGSLKGMWVDVDGGNRYTYTVENGKILDQYGSQVEANLSNDLGVWLNWLGAHGVDLKL